MKLKALEVPKIDIILPLNIQAFAEGDDDGDDQVDNQNQNQDQQKDDKPKGKMYSQDEFEAALKDRLAREKKAAEKAIKEAEKLAKMNEDERKQHEYEKLQKELEELRNEKQRNELAKEAFKMFKEQDIDAPDELLDLVVRATAEDTQSSVNAVVKVVKELVEAGVKAKLAGTPPKKNNSNKALTKADIMAEKDAVKRQRLIVENPHLFKQFN